MVCSPSFLHHGANVNKMLIYKNISTIPNVNEGLKYKNVASSSDVNALLKKNNFPYLDLAICDIKIG